MSTKKSFIERSVQFEEEPMLATEIGWESSSPPPPLIVSEETSEIYNYDMYDNYYLITYPNIPKMTKWEENTIQAVGELAGNPSDSRRTRSQFESALSVKDPLFADKCFLMIESDMQTYEEPHEDPILQKTMKEEFHSLQKNDTCELGIRPLGRKLVKCKWVFKNNFSTDGYPMKYKASLVAKGFSQVQDMDYIETFAPMENMDSIKLVLTHEDFS